MSQTKAQLVQPVGIFTAPGVNVSGVLTASSFSGNLTGTATGLTGTPNVTVGVITATTFYGSGANLSGVSAAPYVGQSTTSQSPTTTINLSLGNVVYFTHNTDTTVAFANTSTAMEVRFIRVKDDTLTTRTITWPSGFIWDGGSAPTLGISTSASDAQIFNLTTRDNGATWYAYEEFTYQPGITALYAWGINGGELGQNNTTNYSSPVQIPGENWRYIGVGNNHSLATKTDGTLWTWGFNNSGVLGKNDGISRYSSPVQIPGTTWNVILAARDRSLATKTDGTLWSWGYNNTGELGLNDTSPRSSPIQIPGTTWNLIGSSAASSFAIKTDGTLWAWGYNGYGNLAQNNRIAYSSPIQIPGTTWSAISETYFFSLAKKTDGTLWSWGNNTGGQLGQNNRTYYSSPVQIPGTTWNFIGGGKEYALATKTDGTLWSWGYNTNGQLGQNNAINYSSPVQIPGTTWNLIGSDDRGQNALATKTDGTLWSWGYNNRGQLGQNNRTNISSPVQIPGTTWIRVCNGSEHSLAIKQIY